MENCKDLDMKQFWLKTKMLCNRKVSKIMFFGLVIILILDLSKPLCIFAIAHIIVLSV